MSRTRWGSVAAVVTAYSLIAQPAHAYPADTSATRSLVPAPAAAGPDGAAPVDASGAATLSIPIPTAPNRNGLVPRLALTYSSRLPVRGGLAMGWALAVPKIELDTTHGRLGPARYRSSEAGRLVRVDEPTEAGWEAYRGEHDASFTRYERHAGMPADRWRARTPDGTVHHFGETIDARDVNHPGAAADALEGRWFLSRTVDHFGNEVRYHYVAVLGTPLHGGAFVPVDIAIASVEYGGNPGAGLASHSRVVFDYAPTPDLCPGSVVAIGARLDLRTGFPLYEGNARLRRISLETGSGATLVERRRLDLTYDADELACTTGQAHAPLRILTAVQETAFAANGVATVLPPQAFTYNRLDRMFDVTTPIADGAGLLGRGLDGPEADTYPEAAVSRPRVETMLLDADGDGRLDRVELDLAAGPAQCTATWRRNLGGFSFAAAAPLTTLPTVPWWNGATRDAGIGELCGLTHQISMVSNRDDFAAVLPETCATTPTPPAPPRAPGATHVSYRFLDWDRDGVQDLVSVIESRPDVYRPEHDPRVASAPTCAVCPGTTIPGFGCVPAVENACVRREEWSCGQHVVRFHRGLPGGGYAPAQTQLVPANFDPQETRQHAIGNLMMDLDGDGRLDGVAYHAPSFTNHSYLVRRNRGDGTFADAVTFAIPTAKGYAFEPDPTDGFPEPVFGWQSFAPSVTTVAETFDSWFVGPATPDLEPQEMPFLTSTLSYPAVQLVDLNGDGLDDLISSRGLGLRAFYNHGTGFQTDADRPDDDRGNIVSTGLTALESDLDKMFYDWGDHEPHTAHYHRLGDHQGAVTRLVDFDGDGLRDVVALHVPEATFYEDGPAALHFNLGDRLRSFGEHPAVERAKAGMAHRLKRPIPPATAWSYQTAFLDLDGDGLPEAINTHVGGVTARSDSDTQPMRLLKAVDNGRGGRTAYRYKVINGPGVPQPLWVVDRITRSSGAGASGEDPDVLTSFDYAQPKYLPDLDGDHGFRGFAVSTAYAATGARTVTTRAFDQSFSGLVTEQRTFGIDDRLVSRTTTTYQERRLFDGDTFPGMVQTFHPTVITTRTCSAGQSELVCAGAGARTVLELFYVALAPAGGAPAMHALQWQRQGESAGGPGSRGTWFAGELSSSGTSYLRYPVAETTFSYGAGGATTIESQTAHYYDGTKRFEHWTSQHAGSGQWAVTSRGFDVATGNLTLMISPRFYGTGPGTTLEYDAQRRFVAATINVLGHRVEATYDPSTGAVTSQRGPNSKACGTGCTIAAGWAKTYDGFGRELAHTDFVDDATLGYRPELISRTTYLDTPSPRTRVTHEQKIELGSTRFTRTEREHDGMGRVVIERTFEGTALRTEARRFHDARGLLTRVEAPRPGAADLGWVELHYAYDDLGRITAAREPTRDGCTGAILAPGFCGKVWSYDGRTVTVEDAVGTAGGAVGRKRETADTFGRLARVEEQEDSGAWAATTYGFDGGDRIVRTESADGVVTTFAYDGLGRRTSVLRGANLWQFGYDLDGNLTSMTAPIPSGGVPADHVSTFAYDALGREVGRTPARRGWGTGELARYGTGQIQRDYDDGVDGLGRLSSVTVDWGDAGTHVVTYDHEARGFVTAEQHHIAIPQAGIDETRTLRRTFTAHGAVESATAADGPTPATSTTISTFYDDRGLAVIHHWEGHGTAQLVQRGSDGRALVRMGFGPTGLAAQSNTAYDVAGRFESLEIASALPGSGVSSTRATQRYRYDGAGDVAQLESRLSATASATLEVATYDYDARHRLVAATGELGYDATFSYSPGGRITGAAVAADPAAARVHRRDVSYTYASAVPGSLADPDAPVALHNDATSGDFLTLTYDRAGNAIARQAADGLFEQIYDGADRQREAFAPDGRSERSFYDGDGLRAVTMTLSSSGAIERVRWMLGNTELWFDGTGKEQRAIATAALDGGAVRILDRDHREFAFQDPRGHTVAVVGDDGALLAGFSYGPYGEVLRELGTDADQHLQRFNGKSADLVNGLSYYGFRFYDERTLTWTQADPFFRFAVRKDGGDTLYSFSRNNPVSNVDLMGLESQTYVSRGWAGFMCWSASDGCLPPKPEEQKEQMTIEMARWLALLAINDCQVYWCKSDLMRKDWMRRVATTKITVVRTQLDMIGAERNLFAMILPDGTFKVGRTVSVAFQKKDSPGEMFIAPAIAPGGSCYESSCKGSASPYAGIIGLASFIAHEALHPTEEKFEDTMEVVRSRPPDDGRNWGDPDEGRIRTMQVVLFPPSWPWGLVR